MSKSIVATKTVLFEKLDTAGALVFCAIAVPFVYLYIMNGTKKS